MAIIVCIVIVWSFIPPGHISRLSAQNSNLVCIVKSLYFTNYNIQMHMISLYFNALNTILSCRVTLLLSTDIYRFDITQLNHRLATYIEYVTGIKNESRETIRLSVILICERGVRHLLKSGMLISRNQCAKSEIRACNQKSKKSARALKTSLLNQTHLVS